MSQKVVLVKSKRTDVYAYVKKDTHITIVWNKGSNKKIFLN